MELSGRNNGGVPQLTEITALRGLEVTGLRYCTTESREGGTIFSGRDYIVAALSSGLVIAAYKN